MAQGFLEKMRSPKALKIAVGVKLTVLTAIIAVNHGGFYIGERPLSAAESAGADASGEQAKSGVEAAGEKIAKAAQNDKPEKAGKTRKSFLSNLLELPELDPESIKKDELGKYLEIAERKKRQVEERLDILKRREEQLKGLETSIDDKLRRLDEERRFFAQTLQQEKELKGERIEKLITMYAKMEPKKAAPVMEKLDKDLVVELFKQMPQKQVTSILETMSPDKSVAISEYYGRVRSAREYDILKEMNQSLRKEFDECKGLPAESATAPEAKTAE